jgi:hypothetical protein
MSIIILSEEHKHFFDKWKPDWPNRPPYVPSLLESYNSYLRPAGAGVKGEHQYRDCNCLRGMNPGGACATCRCSLCGKSEIKNTRGLWGGFVPIVKTNKRLYDKIHKQHFCPTSKLHDLYYNACLKILDLPASLDENPELFYEFHPYVRNILLEGEYVPLFHDVDVHKELKDSKTEIEALKTELAVAKEKLAAIEAEKGKAKETLETELASVLTPTSYNPFN